MPELDFQVEGAEAVPYAASPQLAFKLRVSQARVQRRQLHSGAGDRVQQADQLGPVLAAHRNPPRPASFQSAVPASHQHIDILVAERAALPDQRRRIRAQPRGARDGALAHGAPSPGPEGSTRRPRTGGAGSSQMSRSISRPVATPASGMGPKARRAAASWAAASLAMVPSSVVVTSVLSPRARA